MAIWQGKRGLACAAMLLAVCASHAVLAATGEAQDDAPEPFLGGFLKETRVVYPLEVDGWRARDEKLYDAAELGASVRYQSGERLDRWIDIYFYPVGVVQPSHLDQAALRTLQEISTASGYREVEAGALRSFDVELERDGESTGIPARSADMRLMRDEGAYHSAMVLLVDRMYYVKGRYSVAAAAMARDEVRSMLEVFVAAMLRDTYIGSTGSCGSPLVIEALPADAPVPTDAGLSITSDGGNGAWVVDGRVLARDPASDEAQVLAVLAMSMDGRPYPGCVDAEPHNPEVPEGHREIRFEYRAPTDTRRHDGRILAPSRAGIGRAGAPGQRRL
ncbi:hypothetical protein [Luteimonas sp. A501]